MHRDRPQNLRRYIIPSLGIFIAIVGLVWFVQDHMRSSKITSFVCRSLDDSRKSIGIRISRNIDGTQELIVDAGNARKTFRVDSVQSGVYSASNPHTNMSPAVSLYFNRQTGTAVETTIGSEAARTILLDRCSRKLTADACLLRLRHAMKNAAIDRDDCATPAQSECDAWKSQRVLTFELQFACTPRDGRVDSR